MGSSRRTATDRGKETTADRGWGVSPRVGQHFQAHHKEGICYPLQTSDLRQDPAGVQLYTKTGMLKKGGVELPVYRCALL